MIRFNENEIIDLLNKNDINNLYKESFINEFANDNIEDLEWIKEAFNLIKKDNNVAQITSLSELNAKIDSINNGDPKNVIRILRFFKIITLLFSIALHSSVAYGISTKVFGNDSWVPKSIGQAIVMGIGCSISSALFNSIISDKFIDRLAGKLARMINDCRTSDQEKVRLYNELIKSIDKTVQKSKDQIAKDTLYESMNKVIELRDQVSSRLHTMNKGAKPVNNKT